MLLVQNYKLSAVNAILNIQSLWILRFPNANTIVPILDLYLYINIVIISMCPSVFLSGYKNSEASLFQLVH